MGVTAPSQNGKQYEKKVSKPDSLDVQTSLHRGFSRGKLRHWSHCHSVFHQLGAREVTSLLSIQQGSGSQLAWVDTPLLQEQVGLPPPLKPTEQGCIIHRELGTKDNLPGRAVSSIIFTEIQARENYRHWCDFINPLSSTRSLTPGHRARQQGPKGNRRSLFIAPHC